MAQSAALPALIPRQCWSISGRPPLSPDLPLALALL